MPRHFFVDTENQRLTFNDIRFYLHKETGTWFPSVSTVLDAYPKSAHFFQWLKDNGNEADVIRDAAGDKGSVVHQLTEMYDNGEEVTCVTANGEVRYSSLAWAEFERYVEFSNRFHPEILQMELNMVSPELGIGGTLDRKFLFGPEFGEYEGKKYLVDIKTSNSVQNSYWLQLAAYTKLYEKLYNEKVDGIAILWLNSKTRTEGVRGKIQGRGWQMCFPDKPIEYYWRLFRCVQTLWLEENADSKPRHLTYKLIHKKQETK
jgi:hypothetical protein